MNVIFNSGLKITCTCKSYVSNKRSDWWAIVYCLNVLDMADYKNAVGMLPYKNLMMQ